MNQGKTVLITGASSGIGYAMARVFAEHGFGLILAARNGEKLRELAEECKSAYGVAARVLEVDLSWPDSAVKIHQELHEAGLVVDVLVNNAGTGLCGLFHEMNDKDVRQIIELNVQSLTALTRLFGADMARHGRGRILNVASTGSYQPGPYIAVYYATKAYVLSFSQAIANELKDFGVTVTALCPGATRTAFSKRAGKADLKAAMEPDEVAAFGYRALMRGKRVAIPGFFNRLAVAVSKVLPGHLSAAAVRKIQQPLTEKFR